MNYKIIVDSCCDMPQDLKQKLAVSAVPLTMTLGKKEFIDDETLNLQEFLREMKACADKVGSAAPAPLAYQTAMQSAGNSFVITLSKQLSGSYNSALAGKKLAEEDGKSHAIIVDSKSASAGQTLVALKLRELLTKEKTAEKVKTSIESFVDSMKTYFVLENYDNLQKNGRLGKIVGKLIQVLDIRLIMGSDGKGSISLFKKTRGTKGIIKHLLDLIQQSGKNTVDETLVISHCNNFSLASELASAIKKRFFFREVLLVHTGGLSSLYADNKGIVMAF